ncbi:unnamed protein product [Amoebophrya sp. A120]|nr:unnamed protein product [Amoebophrya sp. A120]|eukprot:GSA120T00016454001.1
MPKNVKTVLSKVSFAIAGGQRVRWRWTQTRRRARSLPREITKLKPTSPRTAKRLEKQLREFFKKWAFQRAGGARSTTVPREATRASTLGSRHWRVNRRTRTAATRKLYTARTRMEGLSGRRATSGQLRPCWRGSKNTTPKT